MERWTKTALAFFPSKMLDGDIQYHMGPEELSPRFGGRKWLGPGRHFRGASCCLVTWEHGLRGSATMRLERHEGSLWLRIWSVLLSRVNFLHFYIPSLFLIFAPIIEPSLDYDLLHTSLSYYGVKPSIEISNLILYGQLLSHSWYIVIAKSMHIKGLNIEHDVPWLPQVDLNTLLFVVLPTLYIPLIRHELVSVRLPRSEDKVNLFSSHFCHMTLHQS